MFEAKLSEGHVFKKIIDSLKDLVKSVNFEANNTGLSMQAMDSSHVALVSFLLHESGFQSFRCDRPLTLGNFKLSPMISIKLNSQDFQSRTWPRSLNVLAMTIQSRCRPKKSLPQLDSRSKTKRGTDFQNSTLICSSLTASNSVFRRPNIPL